MQNHSNTLGSINAAQPRALEKLATDMRCIADRIYGCAGLIDALADCENLNLGLEPADALAAKCISRRLKEYGEIWQVGAKHVATPWLPIDQTAMRAETASHAKTWLNSGVEQPEEIGELFETYADYLEPCLQAFRSIEHRYSDGRAGTDEARTFLAAYFIRDELEWLVADMEPLMQLIYRAWDETPKPN